MILITDSGSTKTDWALCDENGIVEVFHTIGYNPYFTDTQTIYASISENLLGKLEGKEITAVYFYGAGCMAEEKKDIVKKALENAFPDVQTLFVGHDLLAAARGLLGTADGFAGILGTGANSCLYINGEIELNIDSLGYILGDEGSGSYIGKKIVRDFMRGRLDEELHESFKKQFRISDNEQIFYTLYNTNFPNRYLADFFRFAGEHASHPYIRNKVRDGFRDYFKNLVSKYPEYQQYTFNCIGSVGFMFKDILEEVALSYDMQTGRVIRSPLEGLVQFHLDQTNH